MRHMLWTLEGEKVVPAEDMVSYCDWAYKNVNNRIICKSRVGGVLISTVFLGFDHQFGEGPPILFETMVFGGVHDQYQERYTTIQEARKGHELAVLMVRGTWWWTRIRFFASAVLKRVAAAIEGESRGNR